MCVCALCSSNDVRSWLYYDYNFGLDVRWLLFRSNFVMMIKRQRYVVGRSICATNNVDEHEGNAPISFLIPNKIHWVSALYWYISKAVLHDEREREEYRSSEIEHYYFIIFIVVAICIDTHTYQQCWVRFGLRWNSVGLYFYCSFLSSMNLYWKTYVFSIYLYREFVKRMNDVMMSLRFSFFFWIPTSFGLRT